MMDDWRIADHHVSVVPHFASLETIREEIASSLRFSQ
jgi:hypothetical protein